ncbi:MAG: hypothetical protein R2750_05295 [Bacteroidales bacterium]
MEIDSGIDINLIAMMDADMGVAGGEDGLLLEFDGTDWVENNERTT